MATPILTSNDPSIGFFSWTDFSIAYKGAGYPVAAGNTDKAYVWWQYNGGAPTLQMTDTLPDTMTEDDLLLFLNRSGIAINAQKSTFIDGSLLVDGTVAAKALKTEELVVGGNVGSFADGYDPSTKETPEDAQAKADAAQAAAEAYAATKGSIYRQDFAPAPDPNGLWIDTGNGNRPRTVTGKKALAVHFAGGFHEGSRSADNGWDTTIVDMSTGAALPTRAGLAGYDLLIIDCGYSGLTAEQKQLAADAFADGLSVFTTGNDTSSLPPMASGVASKVGTDASISPWDTSPLAQGWTTFSDGDLLYYLTGINPLAFVWATTPSNGVAQPVGIALDSDETGARWVHFLTYSQTHPVGTDTAIYGWLADAWKVSHDSNLLLIASQSTAAQTQTFVADMTDPIPWSDIAVSKTVTDSPYGNKVLEFAGYKAAYHTLRIPFDPDVLYRVTVVARAVSGAPRLYAGVKTYDANGQPPYSNGNWYGTATNETVPSTWTQYTGYFKGNSASMSNGDGTAANPGALNVNTREIGPMMLPSYSGSASDVMQVASYKIETVAAVDEVTKLWGHAANTTLIDGANIFTGSIYAESLDANAIDGKVITGSTLRTAASGRRIEILVGAESGEIQFWNASADQSTLYPGGLYSDDYVSGTTQTQLLNVAGPAFQSDPSAASAYLQLYTDKYGDGTFHTTARVAADEIALNATYGGTVTLNGGTTMNGPTVVNDSFQVTSRVDTGGAIFAANGIQCNSSNSGGGFQDFTYDGGGSTGATINNNGRITRTGSLRSMKRDIKPMTMDEARSLLELESATGRWNDDLAMGDDLWPFFIADDVVQTSCGDLWTTHNAVGEVTGVHYAEITVGLVALVRDLYDRIAVLEAV